MQLLAKRFVLFRVMIGVFWKREPRPIKWHRCCLLNSRTFFGFHIYSPWPGRVEKKSCRSTRDHCMQTERRIQLTCSCYSHSFSWCSDLSRCHDWCQLRQPIILTLYILLKIDIHDQIQRNNLNVYICMFTRVCCFNPGPTHTLFSSLPLLLQTTATGYRQMFLSVTRSVLSRRCWNAMLPGSILYQMIEWLDSNSFSKSCKLSMTEQPCGLAERASSTSTKY